MTAQHQGAAPAGAGSEESGTESIDTAYVRSCIQAQQCPWCGRTGLRSLANHTVTAHGIYADDLRRMAELPSRAALCSPNLSDIHRLQARDHDTTQWLHKPEVWQASAKTREANYTNEQRHRRRQHLDTVRPQAIAANRRRLESERQDPKLAAARLATRSRAQRAFREGAECPICGAWFCSVVEPGRDYRQRKYCSRSCLGEAIRRLRTRTWIKRALQSRKTDR